MEVCYLADMRWLWLGLLCGTLNVVQGQYQRVNLPARLEQYQIVGGDTMIARLSDGQLYWWKLGDTLIHQFPVRGKIISFQAQSSTQIVALTAEGRLWKHEEGWKNLGKIPSSASKEPRITQSVDESIPAYIQVFLSPKGKIFIGFRGKGLYDFATYRFISFSDKYEFKPFAFGQAKDYLWVGESLYLIFNYGEWGGGIVVYHAPSNQQLHSDLQAGKKFGFIKPKGVFVIGMKEHMSISEYNSAGLTIFEDDGKQLISTFPKVVLRYANSYVFNYDHDSTAALLPFNHTYAASVLPDSLGFLLSTDKGFFRTTHSFIFNGHSVEPVDLSDIMSKVPSETNFQYSNTFDYRPIKLKTGWLVFPSAYLDQFLFIKGDQIWDYVEEEEDEDDE